MTRTKHQWTGAHGNPIECIHKYGCQIVGLSHANKRGRDRMLFIKHLTKGTKLVLAPEPNNPLDGNAILVYLQGDFENDIGYQHSSGAKRISAAVIRCCPVQQTSSSNLYTYPRTVLRCRMVHRNRHKSQVPRCRTRCHIRST
jgi:HIRAN domain